MENKNYAKLIDNKIQYATRKFIENNKLIIAKTIDDEFYFSRGYYRVVDIIPYYDSSKQSIQILKWNIDEANHTITSVYEVLDNVVQPINNQVRKFSKLKITIFCIKNNIWQDVKEYLEKIGYYDLFVMAVYFIETDEYFTKGIQMFKEARADSILPIEELDKMIEQMLDFAHDGYVTTDEKTQMINVENEEQQNEVKEENNQSQVVFSAEKPKRKESWFKKFKSDILNKLKV